MARKRVIAYYMHETEAAQVVSANERLCPDGWFRCREIDEDKIAGLEQQGIIFQDLAQPTQTPLRAPEASERVMMAAMDAAPLGGGLLA